jgi:hypothetical protein
VSLVALASHASYLGALGAIALILYYGVKAVMFALVSILAIFSKNEDRRETCLEIAGMICRGWPWLPRLPGR